MPRGLFVTGTDTGVGKSVVSAALLHRYRGEFPLRYWKPVQTGIEADDDTAEVGRLAGCTPEEICPAGLRLERPVSPHLAARLSGVTIQIDGILEPFNAVRTTGAPTDRAGWVVEGAGGVLVPLNECEVMADLMARLDLPVVVVSRTALGTINHTLLTLEAIRRRGLAVAGVVMVGAPDHENRAAIEHYGDVPVIGDMPRFEPLTADALAAWAVTSFDPGGRLRQAFR